MLIKVENCRITVPFLVSQENNIIEGLLAILFFCSSLFPVIGIEINRMNGGMQFESQKKAGSLWSRFVILLLISFETNPVDYPISDWDNYRPNIFFVGSNLHLGN